MDQIFQKIFSHIDDLNTHKKRKRDSKIFQFYETFLKSLYKYYEFDDKMVGLSDRLLYEIRYIYKYYDGNYPLMMYSHIQKLDEFSYELPEEIRLKWVEFYDYYFLETLQV